MALTYPKPPYDTSWDGYIIGTDEAGYGAWAGVLTVAMVAAPASWSNPFVNDSKALTEKAREKAFEMITRDESLFWQIRYASPEEIDAQGVGCVLNELHTWCVDSGLRRMANKPSMAIVDGNLKIPRALSLKHADAYIPAVSAASIIAKVSRDRLMVAADKHYPGYGFAQHKGYGGNASHAHVIALEKLGPCAIHRKSYAPIARVIRERSLPEPLSSWETLSGDDDSV